MAEKDAKLVTALRQAKTMPMSFAFVAKGASEGSLMVAKKKIPMSEINEAKSEVGGGKIFRGRCLGEEGKLIFEMAKEPPSVLAKQLKTIIHRDAGMMLKVEVRIATDLEDESEEGDTEGEIPPPPPVPPPPGDEGHRFTTRLKQLMPDIVKAQAGASPTSQSVKLHASEAQVLARKKEFAQANEVLDRIEKLLPQALAPSPPPPPPGHDGMAHFTARLKALLPVVQKVQATNSPASKEIHLRASEAQAFARKKEFDQANAVLDQIETLLKHALKSAAEKETQKPTEGEDAAASFTNRFKAMMPDLLKAQAQGSTLGQEVKLQISQANNLARKKDFVQANSILDQLEQLLKQGPTPSSETTDKTKPPTDEIPAGLVKYRTALLKFREAVTSVNTQLGNLRSAIANELPDEADMAAELVSQLGSLSADMRDAVDNAINASNNAREPYNKATRATIKAFLAELKGNPLVKHVDKNPFVTVNVEQTLTTALNNIEKTMV